MHFCNQNDHHQNFMKNAKNRFLTKISTLEFLEDVMWNIHIWSKIVIWDQFEPFSRLKSFLYDLGQFWRFLKFWNFFRPRFWNFAIFDPQISNLGRFPGKKYLKCVYLSHISFQIKMPEIGRKSYGCAVKIRKIRIFHIFWPERVHVDFHFVRQNSTLSCKYSKSSKSQLSLNIYIAGHIPYRKKVIPLWNFDIPLLVTFVLNFHIPF